MEFEIKPTAVVPGAHSTLIHFRKNDNADPTNELGSRNPSIFINPGTTSLYVQLAVSGNINYSHDSSKPIDKPIVQNEWSKVKISQLKKSDGTFNLKIQLNGEILHQIDNSQPRLIANAEDWAFPSKLNNVAQQKAKSELRKMKLVTHNCPFGKTWSGTECIKRGELLKPFDFTSG